MISVAYKHITLRSRKLGKFFIIRELEKLSEPSIKTLGNLPKVIVFKT